MIDLDALEAMLAQATPSDWTANRMVHAVRGDNLTPEELGEYTKNSVIRSAGESGSRDFLAVFALKPDGPADVCHVGNGPTSPANAALIAALHNAAPQLLAIARAVKEWGKAEDAAHKDAETDPSAWLAHHMACLDEDNPEQCPAHRHAGIAYQAVELIAQELAER